LKKGLAAKAEEVRKRESRSYICTIVLKKQAEPQAADVRGSLRCMEFPGNCIKRMAGIFVVGYVPGK
jgi:hypothetical protein